MYEQENDFYLTANERNFHFIGFIDAVIRLERMGLIVWDHAEQTVVENENEELDEDDCEEVLRCQQLFDRECEAMKKLILYVETGEE